MLNCAGRHFESRVFFNEYADQEINSPGEPGVFYFMGMGFVHPPPADSKAASAFADMLNRSHTRNRDLIGRINAKITRFQLDYDRDVLPLTPRGNATERHIIAAFQAKALDVLGGAAQAVAYWADAFSIDPAEVNAKIANTNAFAEFLRSKLIKRGGLGYQQPTAQTFPLLDDVIAAIRECRAIPMCAWLDGASQAEQNQSRSCRRSSLKASSRSISSQTQLELQGQRRQAKKIAALDECAPVRRYHLPINVGTEGNKFGQRLVDDFSAGPCAAITRPSGRRASHGRHTRLLRYANVSYIDPTIDGRELTPSNAWLSLPVSALCPRRRQTSARS